MRAYLSLAFDSIPIFDVSADEAPFIKSGMLFDKRLPQTYQNQCQKTKRFTVNFVGLKQLLWRQKRVLVL